MFKIYKIESDKGSKIYIGSTSKHYLSDRMSSHRYGYKKWKEGNNDKTMSYEIFDEYGIDNCKITLLEDCSHISKEEAHDREAFYIQSSDCINRYIPRRKPKQYRQDNKDKLSHDKKEYYQKNRDQLLEYQKQYKIKNKVSLSEKRNTVIQCDCGGHYSLINKSRHNESKIHQKFLTLPTSREDSN